MRGQRDRARQDEIITRRPRYVFESKASKKITRNKAQQRQELLNRSTEADDMGELEPLNSPLSSTKKKRPRDLDIDKRNSTGTRSETEPRNKKPQTEPVTQTEIMEEGNVHHQDENSDQSTQDKEHENAIGSGNKVNHSTNSNQLDHIPALGPEQWGQIMAWFDSFERTIQTTIKDEIKSTRWDYKNK